MEQQLKDGRHIQQLKCSGHSCDLQKHLLPLKQGREFLTAALQFLTDVFLSASAFVFCVTNAMTVMLTEKEMHDIYVIYCIFCASGACGDGCSQSFSLSQPLPAAG